MSFYYQTYSSPLGRILIRGSETGVEAITFVDEPIFEESTHPNLQTCLKEIDEYFRGRRRNFTVKLDLQASAFQTQVLQATQEIPFGTTVAYADIAGTIGCPKGARAVGRALATNKLPLLIPCHRVIGKNQRLTGFAGGIWRKAWLIEHEGKYAGTG